MAQDWYVSGLKLPRLDYECPAGAGVTAGGCAEIKIFCQYQYLVTNNMDVNEHERLSNITLRHTLK